MPVSDATEAPAAAGAVPPAGMVSFCPTFNLVGSTPGLAALSALSVTPFFFAIFASVSPWTTTYSVRAGATGGGTTTGGGDHRRIGGNHRRRIRIHDHRVGIHRRRLVFFADLFAFAALNEHGGQAGDADHEHAEHAEFHA